MHHVSWLRLENYRSCNEVEIDLWPYTPLVGHNNTGKSNCIRGLNWLLNKKALSVSDFYDPAKSVVAIGKIEGITELLINKLDIKHKKQIEKYISDDVLWIKQVQVDPNVSATKIELYVLNPEGEWNNEESWTKAPTGIPAAIKALFPEPIHIEAMSDAAEDAGKVKSGTTIGKLLTEIQSSVLESQETRLKQAIDVLEDILAAEGEARADELKEIDKATTDILQNYFPDLELRTHIPPPTMVTLFKGGTVQVQEKSLEGWRDLESLGHGALRSVQMSLIQYLAERGKAKDKKTACTLLLIDEPELYLHPQAIEQARDALKKLSDVGY